MHLPCKSCKWRSAPAPLHCLAVTAAHELRAASFLVLPSARRLSAVQLVAGGLRASNVSIAAAPPLEPGAARAGFAAAWASAQLCEQSVELHPWQPALATCRQERPLLTDRLLIRLEAAADGTGEAAAGPAGVSQPPGAASSEPAAGTAAPALAGAEAVAAAGVDPPELMLCELSLHGLPAMPDA